MWNQVSFNALFFITPLSCSVSRVITQCANVVRLGYLSRALHEYSQCFILSFNFVSSFFYWFLSITQLDVDLQRIGRRYWFPYHLFSWLGGHHFGPIFKLAGNTPFHFTLWNVRFFQVYWCPSFLFARSAEWWYSLLGSAVAIRCTIPSGTGEQSRVSFSIDDGPARIISQETSPSSQWQHVFWDSGTLEMGPHVLLITNLMDGVGLHLDSIDYEPETLPWVLTFRISFIRTN